MSNDCNNKECGWDVQFDWQDEPLTFSSEEIAKQYIIENILSKGISDFQSINLLSNPENNVGKCLIGVCKSKYNSMPIYKFHSVDELELRKLDSDDLRDLAELVVNLIAFEPRTYSDHLVAQSNKKQKLISTTATTTLNNFS